MRACDEWLCCDQGEQERDSRRMVLRGLLDQVKEPKAGWLRLWFSRLVGVMKVGNPWVREGDGVEEADMAVGLPRQLVAR